MVGQLTLRRPHIAETARLGMLAHATWEQSLMRFFADGAAQRDRMASDLVLYCVGAIDRMIVAELDGEPVGWGARERNYIPYLWVAPDMQGLGAGSRMLTRLEAEMARAGHDRAVLDTLADHLRAIQFYQRHGYVITEAGQMMSRSGGLSVEKVRLVKSLTRVRSRAAERNGSAGTTR